MIVDLDDAQRRNFLAAMAVPTSPAKRVRLVFAIWTESRGYNYGNDGRNTSKGQGVTPARIELLRRTLDQQWLQAHDIVIDRVGSNGRSTGILQQISIDVGGGWGDMVGTLRPVISAERFLQQLAVTDNGTFKAVLQTPTGSELVLVERDPIAADVLRVQQPLATEARSQNYDDDQVAIARAIVAQLEASEKDEFDMATLEDVRKATQEAVQGLKFKVGTFYDKLGGSHFLAYPDGTYMAVPNPMGGDEVLIAHLANLKKMGIEVVDFEQSDPYLFGREVLWSARPV